MKKIIITSFAIVAGVCAFSQSIERKLVASNGTTLVSGGFQLSYSLGEVAVLSASSGLSSPSFFASIGFQQPHVAKIGQVLPKENWVSAYPNPAINIVRLDIHGVNFQSSDIKVFNPIGQTVIAPFTFTSSTVIPPL